MIKPLEVSEADAPKVLDWLKTRGGLSVWSSKDLGGPPSIVTTPYRNSEGELSSAGHWRYGDKPDRHVTEASDVEVCIDVPVETFEIKLKTSGLRIVLQASSERKIGEALARAGPGSYYVFGEKDNSSRVCNGLQYGCDTCTIMKLAQALPLPMWEALRRPTT